MENNSNFLISPYFYPKISVTDAVKIFENKINFKNYLEKVDSFSSFIKMVKFSLYTTFEDTVRKYALTDQQKAALSYYLENLANRGGLINRNELVNSVYGIDDEFSKILIDKVHENEWNINLLIEKLNELDINKTDSMHFTNQDDLLMDSEEQILKIEQQENFEIEPKDSSLFIPNDIQDVKNSQKIVLNNRCANFLKTKNDFNLKSKKSKSFTNFEISGELNLKNGQLNHVKTSSIKKSNEIELDKSDFIKMLLYMEIGSYNECNLVKIGLSDIVIDKYDYNSFQEIKIESILEKLDQFVFKVRSFTKNQFLTDFYPDLNR